MSRYHRKPLESINQVKKNMHVGTKMHRLHREKQKVRESCTSREREFYIVGMKKPRTTTLPYTEGGRIQILELVTLTSSL